MVTLIAPDQRIVCFAENEVDIQLKLNVALASRTGDAADTYGGFRKRIAQALFVKENRFVDDATHHRGQQIIDDLSKGSVDQVQRFGIHAAGLRSRKNGKTRFSGELVSAVSASTDMSIRVRSVGLGVT